ncbi:MAG TPA: hypothetical protein VI078_14950 [bacterium]
MSCIASDTVKAQASAPVPNKHVNYVQGMVLGVDDFIQEFAYHAHRVRWLARDAIGYGTVRGLAVTVIEDTGLAAEESNKWKVEVTGGAALDPCGRLICVPSNQCGFLNEWLRDNQKAAKAALTESNLLDLHLTLSYRDCPTDTRPVPGEPCRSEEELAKPSRIADDFLLELTPEVPKQCEEDGLRSFTSWLHAIPVASGPSSDLKAFRTAAEKWTPDGPAPPADLTVAPEAAQTYWREALRIWVTKLRPTFNGRTCSCTAPLKSSDPSDRLLLATLRLKVESGERIFVTAPPDIDESFRPFLVQTRGLQDLWTGPRTVGSGEPEPVPSGYRVVAAGRIRGRFADGDPTVFGGLKVVDVAKGRVKFSFSGYSFPDERNQYVIKALGAYNPKLPVPAVRFSSFEDDGFVLRVTRGINEVEVEYLQNMEFMIEVSTFWAQP